MKNLNAAFSQISQAFALLGDSIEAARAVRAHRKPEAAVLRRLGIAPETFPSRF